MKDPDIWFVEERNPFGGWSPVTYHGDKPTEKQTGGRRREFRNPPEQVNAGHRGLTLPQLVQVYSSEGKFYVPIEVAESSSLGANSFGDQ